MSDDVTVPGPEERRPGGSRRRVAEPVERSISSTTLLALVVPVLTVGALATVQPIPTEETGHPPSAAPLTRSTVVCPPALPRTAEVGVRVAGPHDGPGPDAGALRARGPRDGEVEVDGGVVRFTEDRYVVLMGEEEMAPGLVASRSGGGAATACLPPSADTWFTGVGAGAEHGSVLQLVNPDGGPAVADVTVLGEDGPVEVPALRGLTVRGNKMVRVDLAEVVPQRAELTLRVQVSRGRLAPSVVDRYDELGSDVASADWLPGQLAAESTSYLLGLGGGTGQRSLVVANPGTDEARVAIRLVTGRSEFTPDGLEDVVVPPGSTVVTDLTRLLGSRAARGTVGLRLESEHRVTATLRSLTGGDLSHAVTTERLTTRAGTPLGSGPKRLVLAGASRITDVTLRLRDAAGRELESQEVTVRPGLGVRTALPKQARHLELLVDDVPVHAAVESGPPGLSVRPLRELVVDRPVPHVRPALH